MQHNKCNSQTDPDHFLYKPLYSSLIFVLIFVVQVTTVHRKILPLQVEAKFCRTDQSFQK